MLGVAALGAAAGCRRRPDPVVTRPAPSAPQPSAPSGEPSEQPAPGRPIPPPTPLPPVLEQRENEPTVRVGLVVDRDSAVINATGPYRIVNQSGALVVTVDGGMPTVARAYEGSAITVSPAALPARIVRGAALVETLSAYDYVMVGTKRYRGALTIQRGTAGVTVVNRVAMEAYLQSVVALELGFRAPSDREAVKAQAVAARSYALRYRGRREALGFDVFPTDADQVYGGIDAELPEVAEAVQGTAGEILTYDGRPIEALFHSTCGWSTESNEQVFQNSAPVPYLRAVSDRFGDGDRDFYCAISPRFRWREEWDGDGLNAILARTIPMVVRGASAIGRVTDIRAGRTTPTGRIYELVVTTTSGTYTVGPGRIREALRPALDRQLWSSMFQLHIEKAGDRVSKVVAAGAGYGHGVGMCQFGAVGRARAGADYRSILATYYHGTTLERIY